MPQEVIGYLVTLSLVLHDSWISLSWEISYCLSVLSKKRYFPLATFICIRIFSILDVCSAFLDPATYHLVHLVCEQFLFASIQWFLLRQAQVLCRSSGWHRVSATAVLIAVQAFLITVRLVLCVLIETRRHSGTGTAELALNAAYWSIPVVPTGTSVCVALYASRDARDARDATFVLAKSLRVGQIVCISVLIIVSLSSFLQGTRRFENAVLVNTLTTLACPALLGIATNHCWIKVYKGFQMQANGSVSHVPPEIVEIVFARGDDDGDDDDEEREEGAV